MKATRTGKVRHGSAVSHRFSKETREAARLLLLLIRFFSVVVHAVCGIFRGLSVTLCAGSVLAHLAAAADESRRYEEQ